MSGDEFVLSFTASIKKEICNTQIKTPCCSVAELLGVICYAGNIRDNCLFVKTENTSVVLRVCYLVKKCFGRSPRVYTDGKKIKKIEIADERYLENTLEELRLIKNSRDMKNFVSHCPDMNMLESICCKKSFLRGAFIVSGSCSDPKRAYHFELATNHIRTGKATLEIIGDLGVKAKMLPRASSYVIYIKDSDLVADILGHIGATNALLEVRNEVILKDFRNNVTRTVNCENANLAKTANAAAKQRIAIEKIINNMGIDSLESSLKELAKLRMNNPEIPLKELGNMLSKPLSKSGVNHKMNKIMEIADMIKGR